MSERERFFQIHVSTPDGLIESELYPEAFLRSIAKLKVTLLGTFVQSVSDVERREAWQWMQRKLIDMYDTAEEIILPSRAGLFYRGEKVELWTADMGNLANENIKRFSVPRYENLDPDQIVEEIEELRQVGFSQFDIGILLQVRLSALFSVLSTETPPPLGVAIIGENASDVTETLLCCLDSGVSHCDFFNLDSDRMNLIRQGVQELRCTPAVFLSSNPDLRSNQNRLDTVMSWLRTGLVENVRIGVPFVFCLREISPLYPLDELLVVQLDNKRLPDGYDAFDKLQACIVHNVISGGDYWAKEFQEHYRKQSAGTRGGENPLITLSGSIISTILRILNLGEHSNKILNTIFLLGRLEMESQLSMRGNFILDHFRDTVREMVGNGSLLVCAPEDVGNTAEIGKKIFFDGLFYMLSKAVLREVERAARFDKKAMLYIRQGLASRELLKQYPGLGCKSKEMEIDLTIRNGSDKQCVSVLAIDRKFWDKPGEIGLWEGGV